MSNILQAALSYAERGWRVVPLIPRGKRPAVEAWQTAATTDQDKIAAWWDANPEYNVGIALGEHSGIVDIEYDSDLGRETAAKLFAETYTPSYASGSRSVHRLFRWSNDLPKTAVIKNLRGLEIRIGGGGRGAQSVFPPSVHPDGPVYQWDRGMSPDDVEIAEIPESVLALIVNDPEGKSLEQGASRRSDEFWNQIVNGVSDGYRNNSLTSLAGKMLRALSDEAFHDPAEVRFCLSHLREWAARCKPPLEDAVVEKTFKSILRAETNRRATEDANAIVRPTLASVATQKPDTGDWRLVIVQSDPPRYELYATQFEKAPGGKIILTAEQMGRPSAIRTEALKQAECGLSSAFIKAWNRKNGLYESLVRAAENVEAPPEEKRFAVVAEMILTEIDKAKHIEEGDAPLTRGASRLTNGNVVFVFSDMVRKLSLMPEAPTRSEMSRVLKMASCGKPRWIGRVRFIFITPETSRELRRLAGSDPSGDSHESHL